MDQSLNIQIIVIALKIAKAIELITTRGPGFKGKFLYLKLWYGPQTIIQAAEEYRIYQYMNSLKFLIFLVVAQTTLQLNCLLYDYSQPTVACVQSCPQGTTKIDSNCLTNYQYMANSQVFLCKGYVSQDHTLCCLQRYYIQDGKCLLCRGQIYNNGLSCCSNDHYLDYSQSTPNCVELSTGACSSLMLNSLFKVCCPSSNMYNLATGQCVSPSGYSCDSTQQVCCPLGQKMQYISNRYQCVSQCSWASSQTSSLFCQQKYCNQANVTMQSGPLTSTLSSLMSFKNECCSGLDSSLVCQKTNQTCLSTFANRGWSICCPVGQFYSASSKSCVQNCDNGRVVLTYVCLSTSKALDLTGNQPTEIDQNYLCNGVTISPNLPVCCPPNFYIKDNKGCQLCSGKIFTVIGYQICCAQNQYFNVALRTCMPCDGILDASGQLCCSSNTYVSYDISGVAMCSSTCNVDNLYQSRYCCQSLTQKCNFEMKPTICNPSYYNLQACKGCPTFCNSTQFCGPSQQSICKMPCSVNQIYYEGVGCLQCDRSCNRCTQPINPSACLSCAANYTFTQNMCQACDANCLTCSGYVNNCTSCHSADKFLVGNRCVKACLDKGFYMDAYKLTCLKCASTCVECTGKSSNCSSCPSTTYLNQGVCSNCDYSCAQCFGGPKVCIKCTSNFYKTQDSTCSPECVGVIVSQYINGPRCAQCHPQCLNCNGNPQNCTACSASQTYLDQTLGINICTKCQSPCVDCTSAKDCLSCLDGYYLSGARCNTCDTSCLTCNGPSNSNCLSCFGKAKLTSSGFCSGCSQGCLICNENTCTSCSQGYILYLGKCITSCPDKTYQNGSSCSACDLSCDKCNATDCLLCSSDYNYVLKNQCYKVCPTNYSPSGSQCIQNKQPDPKPPSPDPNPQPNPNPNPQPPPVDNKSNHSTVATKSGPIVDQAIVVQGDKLFVSVYFSQADFLDVNVSLSLVDKQGNSILLRPSSNVGLDKSNNRIYFSANLPGNEHLSSYSLIQTIAEGPNINSTLISSQTSNQLLLSSLATDTLSNLKVFGYVFSAIILLFIVLTKIKGHFSAQQANNIILHTFNFGQVCYLFKFGSSQLTSGAYFFLNGFGIAHLSFFPNFFSSLIPAFYVEVPYEKSLVPDGNLLRNAGYTFSYQIIVVGLLVAVLIGSLVYSSKNDLEQPIHFRKIMRLGILFMMIGFMNQVFFAFIQLIQPSTYQQDYQSYYNSNIICSYLLIFVIPIVMGGILYHYYKTYDSDVLEHFYTLRQASLFFYIYGQSIIMCLAVGKPLVGMFLILLEIFWFIFNYLLYRYGTGLPLTNFKKYFVISGLICLSYLFLSLEEQVNWVGLVVVVSLTAIALIVYCGYQLVGIYYYNIFTNAIKDGHQN